MQAEWGCGAAGCGLALSGRWILLQALKSRHQAVGLAPPPPLHGNSPQNSLPAWTLTHPSDLGFAAWSVPLSPSLEHSVGAEPCPWVSGQSNPHVAFISVLPVSHKGWLHPHVSNVEALRLPAIGTEGWLLLPLGCKMELLPRLSMGNMAGAPWSTQPAQGWLHAVSMGG